MKDEKMNEWMDWILGGVVAENVLTNFTAHYNNDKQLLKTADDLADRNRSVY